MLAEAFALHQAGRLADAEIIYKKILAAEPKHFDCLHLLGVISNQRGNYAAALRQIESALEINPGNALALINRGNTLNGLNRFEDAVASYDRALAVRPDLAEAHFARANALYALQRLSEALAGYDAVLRLRPDHAEAYHNRSNTLHQLHRFEEALTSLDRALALRPDYVEAHCGRGNALYALDRFEQALTSYDRALTLRPDYADALTNRGLTLHRLKRFEQALASYDRALGLRPDDAATYYNRGNSLSELKRSEQALASYDRSLVLRPNYAEAHCGRGNALYALGRFEEALAKYDLAVRLRSNYAEALSNRGLALHELRRFEEALASCEQAIALRPDYAEALINRGVILQEQQCFEEALASYRRAQEARPHDGRAHYNEAICRMLIGDLARGFEKYEWRWETEGLAKGKRNFPKPLWTGSDEIEGKIVLFHAEQGLGDTIQFCRYVPIVARQAAGVILEVQKPLQELMRTLPGTAQIVSRGERLPHFEMHCPLLSLPRALRTQLETIPAETPYLSAPESKTALWRDRLGPRRKRRVGIVWAGNPRKEVSTAHRMLDRQRSLDFDRLAPVFQVANCDFYSLQKGDDAVLQLRDSPLRQRVIDWTDDLHDFTDTAAFIENLDLVISVDTSVAHLAGALGKPFWLLNRHNGCWRWLLDRDDSPWYPTARLFRQDLTRDWNDVVARIVAALRAFCAL